MGEGRADDEPALGGLEREWEGVMRSIYRRAKLEAGYTAGYFLQMLDEIGGLETARQLLHKTEVSDGFTNLWELGHLNLTVEAHVLDEQFRPLFTDEELRIARQRLEQYEYRF